jgi:hypothetical protein
MCREGEVVGDGPVGVEEEHSGQQLTAVLPARYPYPVLAVVVIPAEKSRLAQLRCSQIALRSQSHPGRIFRQAGNGAAEPAVA